MPYVTIMPIFTEDVFKVGATGLGILMSISGIGAIVGSLVLASLPNKKRGLMLLLSSIAMGLILAAFSFSGSWPLSLVLIGLVGMAHAARMSLSVTMLQYYAPVAYRGRVMSIFMMEIGLMSFGTFSVGLLTEAVGVQWALGSFSIALMILSCLALIFLPRIRNLD
jgi:MFS transporter, DHA1 family, staphyloferrin A biosynthesis exporter